MSMTFSVLKNELFDSDEAADKMNEFVEQQQEKQLSVESELLLNEDILSQLQSIQQFAAKLVSDPIKDFYIVTFFFFVKR